MKVFNEAFWYSTKIHLLLNGSWPFQPPLYGIIVRCIVFSLIESIMILEIIKLALVWGNLAQTVTVLPTAIFATTAQITASCNYLHINKVKNLLVIVKNFWESDLLDESEIKILKNDGIAHKAAMHSYYFLYYLQPVLYGITTLPPVIFDIFMPINETRERTFIFHDCYGLDSQKYSSYILLHNYIAIIVLAWTFVTFKTNYFTMCQTACSMFTIIGRRLRNLGDGLEIIANNKVKSELIKSIAVCVKMHQDALEFVSLLEDNYSFVLLLILTVNAIGLSTIGFRFVAMASSMEDNIQCCVFLFGQVLYIYYLSSFGQKLMDHSAYVFESICAAKTYNFPPEMKPMVVLLMVRSNIVCRLSAGKIFFMTLENFANVMKTSFSYCTILLSLQ